MIPIEKVKKIILRHKSLEKELSSGQIEKEDYAIKSKEYADLNDIIPIAEEFTNFENNKKDLNVLINDKNIDDELKEIAKRELDELILKNKHN